MNLKLFFPATLAVAFLLSGCNLGTPSEPQAGLPAPPQAEQQTKATIAVVGDAESAPDETTAAKLAEEDAPSPVSTEEPQYVAYSAGLRSQLHGSKPYVLFFHADWCPVCREMEKNITAQLSSFPEGTKILKANYDTETGLKDEFGIKIQSTVVVLDAEGNVVWQGQDPAMEDFQQYIRDSLG